jgi:S1-C subfamily serine protease
VIVAVNGSVIADNNDFVRILTKTPKLRLKIIRNAVEEIFVDLEADEF